MQVNSVNSWGPSSSRFTWVNIACWHSGSSEWNNRRFFFEATCELWAPRVVLSGIMYVAVFLSRWNFHGWSVILFELNFACRMFLLAHIWRFFCRFGNEFWPCSEYTCDWPIFFISFHSQDNQSRMQKLVDKLQNRINVIVQGGGEKAVARHTSRGDQKCFKI